jgi:hypothetical protein
MMILKEKIKKEKIYINPYDFKLTKESVENFEKIAEEFAIGFAEWLLKNYDGIKSVKEQLKIYKKGL